MSLTVNLLLSLLLIFRASYGEASTNPPPEVKQVSPEQIQSLMNCHDAKTQVIDYYTTDIDDYRGRGYYPNLKFTGSFGKSDTALILFAIVGVVVIVAVIPYAIKYIYDLSIGTSQCYFHQIGIGHMITRAESDEFQQDSRFYSVNYGVHIDRKDSADIGLAIELGVQNLEIVRKGRFSQPIKRSLSASGLYAMVGPKLYLGRTLPNPSHGYIQLLGGRSFDSELGLLAKAEVGYNFINRNNFGFGLAIGSLYSDIGLQDGFTDKPGTFSLFFSVSAIFSVF